jgi:threonine dehydrogenase-like Zn-dependent dehydrogenase
MSPDGTMQALVCEGPWDIGLQQMPVPRLDASGVLVRVRATGICGTDLGIIAGAYPARTPIILGHESAGQVVKVGENVADLVVGNRVVINPTYHCDLCRMCRTGRPNHCAHKSSTEAGVSCHGTFASYYQTESRFLYRIPDHIKFDEAVLTEPLSCALTGLSRLLLRPDLNALVIGAGPMGILYAHGLALYGLSGAVVEPSPGRRAAAGKASPAGFLVHASLDDAVDASSYDGEFDVIVETTGKQVQTALSLLAPGGQLLTISLGRARATVDPGRMTDRSLSLVGSIDSHDTFSTALHLLVAGRVPADRIVTAALPLAHFRSALALLGCDVDAQTRRLPQSALKLVLRP